MYIFLIGNQWLNFTFDEVVHAVRFDLDSFLLYLQICKESIKFFSHVLKFWEIIILFQLDFEILHLFDENYVVILEVSAEVCGFLVSRRQSIKLILQQFLGLTMLLFSLFLT